MKLILLIFSLMAAVCAQAGMARVVSVDDHRSLTIEQNGRRERIELAGIEIVDAPNAARLLVWTIGTSWVLVEKQAGGGHLVYRSPDALFVNRELVLRGYARATAFGIAPPPNLNVTYLGEVEPPLIAPARGTGSDTRPRSTARPSRRGRALPKAARLAPAKRAAPKSEEP